jgi:hypothetical protein
MLHDVNSNLDDHLEGNKPTPYDVIAVFENENARNVAVYGHTLNGTRYPVFTTIHYGSKPAVNCFTLSAKPPKTEVEAALKDMLQGDVIATQTSAKAPPAKTPEEMHQEAEQDGSLRVWNEFLGGFHGTECILYRCMRE